MWFKNIVIYRFTQEPTFDLESLEKKLEKDRFTPCLSQALSSYGWSSPMGTQGESLVHSGFGFILLCAKKQERILPASVIKDFVNERVGCIEEEQMRKLSRRERDEIKDETVMELTPRAFTRSIFTYGLLAPELGYLLVDSSSAKRADEFTSYLRKTLGSLPIKPLEVKEAPASFFTGWLEGRLATPEDITIGRECELTATDDEGGVVRCSRHQLLESDEIRAHLQAGKFAVKLALQWQDSLSFVLDNELSIKKLRFSDVLKEQAGEDGSADPAAEFDAAFTLSSLELARLVPRLTEIFGGIADET